MPPAGVLSRDGTIPTFLTPLPDLPAKCSSSTTPSTTYFDFFLRRSVLVCSGKGLEIFFPDMDWPGTSWPSDMWPYTFEVPPLSMVFALCSVQFSFITLIMQHRTNTTSKKKSKSKQTDHLYTRNKIKPTIRKMTHMRKINGWRRSSRSCRAQLFSVICSVRSHRSLFLVCCFCVNISHLIGVLWHKVGYFVVFLWQQNTP